MSEHEGEGEGEANAEASADPAPSSAERDPVDVAKEDKPRGNPIRMEALLPLVVGALGAFLFMAHDGRASFGIPVGLLFVLVASFGLLDLIGTFDDAVETESPTLAALTTPFVKLVVSILAFSALVGLAGKGAPVPGLVMGLLITGAFVYALVSGYGVAKALNVVQGSITAHPGFWLLTLAALIHFPMLGMFSLSDPWETHYGEVAREILARNDWISLWWAQDGWFWSKPILNFWIQALAMGSLGTGFTADQMLQGLSGPGTAHPEWVVRTPNVLLTLLGMYLLYKGVARAVNKRAAFLGALILATMPDWYFLAHQTMADMPYVAPMTGAMGLMLLGMNTEPEENAKSYGLQVGGRTFSISLFHVVFGAILIVSIPQILYLASRNVELVLQGSAKGFRFHWDEFQNGSALNCGLPGNEACRSVTPVAANKVTGAFRLIGAFEPITQALVWAASLGALLHLNRGERRTQRLLYLGAWFLAAIATMGKGPVGLVLPMAATFVYILSARRFGELLRFEIWSGILVIACVATPWFVAMYVRHGSPFIDRLFIHDMFNRTLGHVHDTNEGDDTSFRFYIWQLGYALFPWVGLAPLGLTFWARRGDADRGGAATFLTLWFAVCFGLFTFMGTKFHHYIFPAVPPIAMLVGLALDDALTRSTLPTGKALAKFSVWGFAGVMLLLLSVALALPGPVMGTRPLQGDAPGKLVLALGVFAAGAAALALWFRAMPRDEASSDEGAHDARMFSAALVSGLFAFALVGRDLLGKGDSGDQPGAIRFLQLFTYNYRRPWPVEDLDFYPALAAITVIGFGLTIALAVPRLRAQATMLICAFGFAAALWGTDVYFVKVSPHWGQRELFEAYYRDRKSADEQVVAYQMNWKGENFYTSNRVPAFVSSGQTFTNWLKTQREKGAKVMYFVTEHSRTGGLRSEVGAKSYKEVTDRRVNNKFVLIRAEL